MLRFLPTFSPFQVAKHTLDSEHSSIKGFAYYITNLFCHI